MPSRDGGHGHLAQGSATIDEQSAAGDERAAESLERLYPCPWMAPIKGSYSNGEGDVVARLARFELELLGRDLTRSQATGRDEPGGSLGELGDRLRRTVDCENVALRADTVGDGACCSTGIAADLDDPETGAERQRIHDPCQSRRQGGHPCDGRSPAEPPPPVSVQRGPA